MIHRVHEPQIQARLGTTPHFCEVVVLKLRAVPGAVQRAGPAAFGADGAIQREEGRQDPGVRHGANARLNLK